MPDMPDLDDPSAPEILLYQFLGGSPVRAISATSFVLLIAGTVLFATSACGLMIVPATIALPRGGVGAFVWLMLSVGPFLAVYFYERRTAARVSLLPATGSLHISIRTLFGEVRREVLLCDLVRTRYHGGDICGERTIASPWLWVHVRDRPSFLLPLHAANIPDRARLMQVLGVPPRRR